MFQPSVNSVSDITSFAATMPGFQEEKEKCLKRTVMERKTGSTITLNYVDNWQEYYVKNLPSLLASTPTTRKGYSINTHANDIVSLYFGDVTKLLIDVIVSETSSDSENTKNASCPNIDEEAGDWLQEELRSLPKPKVAEVVMTGAYRLPAKYIFHVYGSTSQMRDNHRLCYKNCLDLARQHQLKTIAFPCISTDLFGYAELAACEIALETVREYIDTYPNSFERILFYMDSCADSRTWYDLHMPHFFPVQ